MSLSQKYHQFYQSFSHYATTVLRDISKFGHLAIKAEPFIETPLELLYPPAIAIDRLANMGLGKLVEAADSYLAAQLPNAAPLPPHVTPALTIQVTQSDLESLKFLADFVRSHATASGINLPPAAPPPVNPVVVVAPATS